MFSNFKLALVVSLVTLLTNSSAFAADEFNTSTGITSAGVPLGVHGVDTVALSTLGAVAEGTATYTVVEDGVAYYFATQSSADKFSKNPDRYLPQFGGFCAYAVAFGKKFDGDPQFADIVDGKLYLFVNGAVLAKYKLDPQRYITDAHKMWPKIRSKAVGDL
jgi:YHS domain-containing protein